MWLNTSWRAVLSVPGERHRGRPGWDFSSHYWYHSVNGPTLLDFITGPPPSKVEKEVTLEDILVFFTGCDNIPPLGFSPEPSLEFIAHSRFPLANTC
ncbi:hypothetical protein L3Q82_003460 [Scortum barcoo]|uniref:Uncharacterized protein n=1 Tax=Scortum barcoo TaxID=214431 RepID=A0ACB8VM96_9TELE|nr:hypothetical protein L3Q82_003460 [Scortum barcoo]